MTELPQVTMIAIDCINQGGAIAALKKSQQQIKPACTILLTDRQFNVDGIETIIIDSIKSRREYSRFIIKELYKYFSTSHVLLIQADGYVLNGDRWTEEFLEWDYTGSPWNFDSERLVGNGGFSCRSHRLCKILGEDNFIDVVHPEDQSICVIYKFYLEEKYGIKFCPVELAETFAYELREPVCRTFGFHQFHWPPFQETVVIKRTASLGDVIQTEAVMHHFHMKGFRVVLETLPQFYELFRAHYFPVIPFGQLNPKIPYTHINLDMSYESDPKKLHLKAYYEFAGVPESEQVIRNPKLNFVVDHTNTLFPKKYVVLHLDKRGGTPHRDVNGVDWKRVVDYLNNKGYVCFQIGKGESDEVGAIRMQTLAEPMLAYLIAGCALFVGIDSGPSNVAVATGRKMIVFHGSVNPEYIYPDMTNVKVITNHGGELPVCQTPYCWHNLITVEGQPCTENKELPPCSVYETSKVIDAINYFEN